MYVNTSKAKCGRGRADLVRESILEYSRAIKLGGCKFFNVGPRLFLVMQCEYKFVFSNRNGTSRMLYQSFQDKLSYAVNFYVIRNVRNIIVVPKAIMGLELVDLKVPFESNNFWGCFRERHYFCLSKLNSAKSSWEDWLTTNWGFVVRRDNIGGISLQ